MVGVLVDQFNPAEAVLTKSCRSSSIEGSTNKFLTNRFLKKPFILLIQSANG